MAARLASLIEVCERHLRFLNAARAKLPQPILGMHLTEESDAIVAALDQFAFRFVRLQDTLGAMMFRAVLVEILREPYEEAPLGDVLDRLEALRLLDSADGWERIRAMRNALAHDYPESPEEKAAALNVAMQMADEMATILNRLRTAVESKPRGQDRLGSCPGTSEQ